MGREYSMEFQLNAKKGGAFSSTFSSAQREIAQFQQEYRALTKAQADISAYKKQQAAVSGTEAKLRVLQQQYDNIQREIQETEGFSSSLENRLLSKQQQIDQTTKSINQQTERLNKYGESLHDAGVDTDHLEDASRDLTGQMDALKKKIDQAGDEAKDFGNEGADSFEKIESALTAAGIARGLQEIYEWYAVCGNAAIEYESSITGVYKTVDGTKEQLTGISDAIMDMTEEIPATKNEISAVAEAAGQLGIATDDVMSFTKTMIDLGESTNLTADESASSLAKFSNITKMEAENYSRLGSVVVALGNNYATTEADIVAMSIRLASSGKLAGLTEAEIMALAASMSSVGIEAEAGGTAMTQTLSSIEKAVAKGGDDLEKFAKISGMSAAEFTDAWKNDPITAIQAFISGIGTLDQKGESAVLVLDELGLSGVRQSNMLKSLGLASEMLGDAVGTANTAWSENIALTEEANKRYATTASQQVMMQNAYNNLQVEIGNNFTPALQKLYKISAQLFSETADFVKQYPAITKLITALIVGGTGFVAVLTGYVAISKLAKIATKELTAAMAANPYLMLGAAIAGVVVALGSFVAMQSAAEEETEQLTATSEQQREKLKSLESEYKAVSEAQGETSAEAQILKAELDEATASFEDNKKTSAEFVSELQKVHDAYAEMSEQHNSAIDEILTEKSGTIALIQELNELTSAEEQSAESKQKILTIVDLLNQRIPELGIHYDELTGKLNLTPEEIQQAALADYNKQAMDANYKRLQYEMGQKNSLETVYSQVKQEKEALDAAVAQAKADYFSTQGFGNKPTTVNGMDAEHLLMRWNDLKEQQEEVNEKFTAAEEDYLANKDAIDSLTSELAEYHTETDSTTESVEQMNQLTGDLTTSMAELAEAYTEAYNAAYESVSGQYALWDEAAKVTATSTESINSNLEGQITYWQDYNSNLASLRDRAADIEGLSDVIASFADGSTDSVNAVAGMASASDEDLKLMVENWQTLQAEQSATATSIAELQTDFTASMNELQSEFEETVKGMEISDVAASSAAGTIQAFIDQADQMLPQVQAAYARLGQAAGAALGSGSGSGSGGSSRGGSTGKFSHTPIYGANANGTLYADEAFIAGEEGPELILGRRGASVFPAQETQRIIDALPGGGNNSQVVEIRFAPVYHLDGVSNAADLERILAEHDGEMRDYILQVMAEAGADAVRREYA